MMYRSPLKRARGLGSAKEGSHHWLSQRLSAMALAVLMVWFLCLAFRLIGMDFESAHALVHKPYNAIVLILVFYTIFTHAKQGLDIVLEDYIHSKFYLLGSKILVTFISIFLTVLSIFSILKIAFGA